MIGLLLAAGIVVPLVACGGRATSGDSSGDSSGGGSPATTLAPLAPLAPTASLEPLASSTSPAPDATHDVVTPEGFGTVLVRTVQPDGTVCESCMWLAETSEERARGLMGVSDLAGLEGMVFRYGEEAQRGFWMKNTLLPLSIAFVDAGGRLVDTADMVPCAADPCPSYGSDGPFLTAIEVPEGRLGELGITDGATIELVGACTA